jgi:hypothetical protein
MGGKIADEGDREQFFATNGRHRGSVGRDSAL